MKFDSEFFLFFLASISLLPVGCTTATAQPDATTISQAEALTIARRVRTAQASLAENRKTDNQPDDENTDPFEQSTTEFRSKTPSKQVWMITARGCSPCEQWKQMYLDLLREAGWSVGSSEENQFRIIDVKLAGSIFPSLKETWCPHFVYIIDGKIVREATKGIGARFSMGHLRRLIDEGSKLQVQNTHPVTSRCACNPCTCKRCECGAHTTCRHQYSQPHYKRQQYFFPFRCANGRCQ